MKVLPKARVAARVSFAMMTMVRLTIITIIPVLRPIATIHGMRKTNKHAQCPAVK